jgi:hypothetical protein
VDVNFVRLLQILKEPGLKSRGLYSKIMNPGKEETILRINTDDAFSGEATLADE